MRINFLLFLMIFFFNHLTVQAQYDVRNIGRVKNLTTGTINTMEQDNDGFIWIGTRNGLYRYDGYELKQYNSQTSNLVGEDIMALLFDSNNRLWIGTVDGGLNLYNREDDSFKFYKADVELAGAIESNDVRAIHEDRYQNVWVATKHGLNRYLSESDKFQVIREGFENYLIRDLTSDSKGNIWCGTFGGGVSMFNTELGKVFQYSGEDEMRNLKVQSLAITLDDRLLVGTRDNGLLQLDVDAKKFKSFFPVNSPHFKVKSVSSILLDEEANELWIGTDGDGILTLKRSDESWRDHPLFNTFDLRTLGNGVYSIFKDLDRNLWVGSAWQGLFVLEHMENEVSFFRDLVKDQPVPVWSTYSEDNKVWLGTDGYGLFIHEYDENGRRRTTNHFEGMKILSISPRVDGRYWIGTYSHGLILFDGKKEIRRYHSDYNNSSSLSSNDIRDVLSANEGYWVATWAGGLNFLDSRTNDFTSYKFDPNDQSTLSNNNITMLERTTDGRIWIATFGGGVNLFDPKTRSFERIQYESFSEKYIARFGTKNITCLLDDEGENLWVGTWTHGLNKVDLKSGDIMSFDQYDALRGKTICGIFKDKNDNIWIGTEDAIHQYIVDKDTVLTYSDLDGQYHFGAAHQTPKGEMFFAGLNGAISFVPENIGQKTNLPQVRITDFKLFNKSVEIGEGHPLQKQVLYADDIKLDYDQRVMTFEFGAIRFPFSDNSNYLIKMENFDSDWRNNGASRTATYTNLSPGKYKFKVKAITDNGGLVGSEASVNVFIKKPYWATWWAYAIYVGLILVLLYFYRRYSIYWEKMKSQLKLERLSREKEAEIHEIKLRFFTNISHEIRTPVTLILGSINRLIESGITDKVQHTAIEAIKKNGSHLYNLVTELLDFRKLESGEASIKVAEGNIVKFSKEIYLSFSEHAQRRNIDYAFTEPSSSVQIWYDRDEMEKVLYNIISNAFKYTDAGGRIEVAVNSDEQAAYISISDSGRGIPSKQLSQIFKRFYQSDNKMNIKQEDSGFGLGLAIVYDIIKLHGGEILAESEPGRGTKFTIKLLKGNNHLKSEFIINEFRDSEQIGQYVQTEQVLEAGAVNGKDDSKFFADQSEMTVLVAEDNEGIREYLHGLLKESFNVILASNGKEALDMTFDQMPDLVLSDVMMPEMDGITYASKIKNDPRTSHIPVIILTARTSLIYKKEGLDLGVDDYVTKPFSETLLKTRIRNLLNNRVRLREKYKTDLLIQPSQLAMRSPDQEFLSTLSQIIEKNMGEEDLSTDFICREMGMSQSNIYKKLKALTGMSIVEFVRDFRLKQAAQLIVNQKLSVSEACFKVGFNDRRYFSQVFKSKYGMTPSEYAKKEEV